MARIDTDLLGLQIISRADASIVGEVDALIIDDSGPRVVGFLVDLGVYEASVLPFGKATAIGADAVIVESADSLTIVSADTELERLAVKDVTITDATAITVSGKSVGILGDYYVDTESGDIVGVEFIPSDFSVYPKEPAVIPASCIERLGRDIAVLKDNYHQHLLRDGTSLERLSRPFDYGETVDGAPSEALPEPRAVELEPSPEPEPLFVPEEESASQPIEPGSLVEGPSQAEGDLADQPKHFLIGKKVQRRIEDAEGTVVAEQGEVVDNEMIMRAKDSDMLLILSLNVE
jgi:uncharacterized protein YrrD